MGKIDTSINRSKDLTLNRAKGLITLEDLLKTTKKYLSEEPTGKVLWDFQEADGSALSSDELQSFYRHLRKLPTIAKERKVAIVVSRSLGYGISRMSSTYAKGESIPAEYYITYSIEEALAWLDVDMTAEA